MRDVPQIWSWLLALTSALAFAMVVPTCSRADEKVIIEKPATARTPYHYLYYPDAEIYLVPETHEYWVRESGAWHSVMEVPAGISLGGSVALDVDKPDPWTTHEVIVKKYGGKNHKVKIKESTKETDGDDVKIKEKTKEKYDND